MTAAPRTAFELQFRDSVEEQNVGPRERGRPLLRGREFETRSEAFVDAAFSGGADLRRIETRGDFRYARRGRFPAVPWGLGIRAP